MKKKSPNRFSLFFNAFSEKITKFTGSPIAFVSAFFLIILWAVTGLLFHFADTWQLVINTGTTIITFLMVFIIQQTQNKDTMALQLKLNELIACNHDASNRLIAAEDLTEEELDVIKKFYQKLSSLAKKEDVFATHSLDEAEAEDNHNHKHSKK